MRKASLLKIILSLLLSAIMIVGFVACGGADAVTGSASQTTPTTPDNGGNGGSEDLGDNNGDSGNTWNVDETKGQTFAQDTYIDIYVAGLVESDEPFNYKVSYEVPIV